MLANVQAVSTITDECGVCGGNGSSCTREAHTHMHRDWRVLLLLL